MEKVAIITGASKGIGKKVSLELGKSKINVCLLARSYLTLKKLSKFIEKNYKVKALPIKTDLSNVKSVKYAIKKINEKFNRIDYLINLAGYPLKLKIWNKFIHEIEEEDILTIFNVDFLGSFRMIKECLPFMIKQNYGVIINISSIPAISGNMKGFAYSISKAANIVLTKFLAREYGKYNIRAYTIALGSIKTKGTYELLSKEEREELKKETSLKRWGKPEEIAKLIKNLISENFSFVTGQTIIADGGVIMI